MYRSVLLEYFKMDHAERIRQAEMDRMYAAARRANPRPSILRTLLLMLGRS